MKLRTTIFIGGLVSQVIFSGCARKENVIKIGEYGSLTGTTATFGISTKNGIDMALEEINAEGGLLGKKVQVIVEDDQARPEEAANAVKKLINLDKVVAVLGEVASSRSLAGAPVCQAAKIPMVTPSSTNPAVTQKGDYIFRVCFTDDVQGYAAAVFTLQSLGKKKVAILKDVKNDYSVGLAEFFKQKFTQLGGKIVAEEAYTEGDQDFNAQLTAIKAKKPEAIFIPGYYTEVGLIAQQAKKLQVNAVLVGGDGWESPKLLDVATVNTRGDALHNSYFTTHYAADEPRPIVQKFVSKYRERYQETPDAIAPLAYDAARILFDAIGRAGSTEGSAIREALAQTRNFEGVSGVITIDENRNARKPVTVLKIENGEYKFLEQIQPEAVIGATTALSTTEPLK